MYSIIFVLLTLCVILGFIVNEILDKIIFPVVWKSPHMRDFDERILRSPIALCKDLAQDTYSRLERLIDLCGSDEDELDEQSSLLDSSFDTYSTCDYVFSPPKEEISPLDQNSNRNGGGRTNNADPPRRRQPRRGRIIDPPPEVIPRYPEPHPDGRLDDRELRLRLAVGAARLSPERRRQRMRPVVLLPGLPPGSPRRD